MLQVNLLHDHILEARGLIERGRWVHAQNLLLEFQGSDFRVDTQQEAEIGIMGLYHSLLNAGDWTGAALLRWGKTLFNPDPRSVQLIWTALCDPTKSKLLIMGCGSSGKTYSTSGWVDLNWSRDPEYTTIKIVSTTLGHNKSNIMSKIGIFHTQSLMKFPGEPVAGGIAYPGLDKSASITAVAIPEGESGEGRLTGFHPYPRPKPHPIFGPLSRCVVVIDEADAVPEGLWAGVDNALGNEDFQGSIKVVALTNPRLKQNSFAHRAEPEGGWSNLDEDAEQWTSKDGWHVISIDAAKSENVLQKKQVFPGLMTYEGYQNYVRKGKNDPKYWTYARGKYPPDQAATFNVFASAYFDNSIGRLMFEGDVTPVAAFDGAFAEGGDDAVLTIGRFGFAIGFTDTDGTFIQFKRGKKMVQVEQQINITKGPTHVMGEAIIKILRSYGVRPEWFVMDKTGNARGLYDHIHYRFGAIMGIEWGGKATETKILREDTENAAERYKGIAAEMWFAASMWQDHGHVKFSPTMEGFRVLRDEACARQWKFKGTLQELESKVEFKKHNKDNKSCDRADSYVMLIHPIRIHSQGLPETIEDNIKPGMKPMPSDRSMVDDQIPFLPDHRVM